MKDAVHYNRLNVVTRCSDPTEVTVQDKNPVCYCFEPRLGFVISHYIFTTGVGSALIKLFK